MDELKDKLADEDRDKLKKSIEDLKEVNKGSDVEMIEKSINDLNGTWQSLSEKLYQQTKDAPQGPVSHDTEDSNQKKNTDEVEEADFEEVK